MPLLWGKNGELEMKMTVEEAIEVLKSECYVFNPLNFDRTTLINTALDTIIEALEKKSCEEKKKGEKK